MITITLFLGLFAVAAIVAGAAKIQQRRLSRS
jgi:hypothetical protein